MSDLFNPVDPPADLPPDTLKMGDPGFMTEPAQKPLWMADGTLVEPGDPPTITVRRDG